MSEVSLRERTIKGVAWNSIDRIANYGISFVVSIVLARLLSPEDYGLIGIISIFISIFNVILDGGLSTALIRKNGVDNTDYTTVFWSNIILSVFLTLTLYALAPLIATFFQREELVSLIRVMSLILIINALSITQQTILTKKIDFKTQTKITIIAFSLSGILGIIMAFCGFGVWSLVGQQVSGRIFSTILLWIYIKWIPSFIFSIERFKELFGFGWKLLLTRVIRTVWGQLYQAIIGKFYNAKTLGLYTRAAQYGQMCSTSIGDVVLKVSLPVMSEVQSNENVLLSATRRIIKETMYVTFILMFWMAASAKALIFVLIGEQWLPCVPFLQILCFNLVMNPLCYINENLLSVKGRSDKLLILQFWKIALSIIPLLCGIFIGIYWMLISSVIESWIGIVLYTYYTNKYFGYSWRDQFKDILPSLCLSIFMALPVYILSFLPISLYIILPLQIILGGFIVIFASKIFKIEEFIFLEGIILNGLKRIVGK